MGERVNGIHEVRGSIPLASTRAVGRTGGWAVTLTCVPRPRNRPAGLPDRLVVRALGRG